MRSALILLVVLTFTALASASGARAADCPLGAPHCLVVELNDRAVDLLPLTQGPSIAGGTFGIAPPFSLQLGDTVVVASGSERELSGAFAYGSGPRGRVAIAFRAGTGNPGRVTVTCDGRGAVVPFVCETRWARPTSTTWIDPPAYRWRRPALALGERPASAEVPALLAGARLPLLSDHSGAATVVLADAAGRVLARGGGPLVRDELGSVRLRPTAAARGYEHLRRETTLRVRARLRSLYGTRAVAESRFRLFPGPSGTFTGRSSAGKEVSIGWNPATRRLGPFRFGDLVLTCAGGGGLGDRYVESDGRVTAGRSGRFAGRLDGGALDVTGRVQGARIGGRATIDTIDARCGAQLTFSARLRPR